MRGLLLVGCVSVAGNSIPQGRLAEPIALHMQGYDRAQLLPAAARKVIVPRPFGERDAWYVTVLDALLHNQLPLETWLPLLVRHMVATQCRMLMDIPRLWTLLLGPAYRMCTAYPIQETKIAVQHLVEWACGGRYDLEKLDKLPDELRNLLTPGAQVSPLLIFPCFVLDSPGLVIEFGTGPRCCFADKFGEDGVEFRYGAHPGEGGSRHAAIGRVADALQGQRGQDPSAFG